MRLFNAVIHRGTTLEARSSSVVVHFFKKGDNFLLKNYRRISLLSPVYKLFSRVDKYRRITTTQQIPITEADWVSKRLRTVWMLSTVLTVDHIHTVRQIAQKTEEYK